LQEETRRAAAEEASKIEALRIKEERHREEEAVRQEAPRNAAKEKTHRIAEEAKAARFAAEEEAAKAEAHQKAVEEEANNFIERDAKQNLALHARSRVLSDSESSGTENEEKDEDEDEDEDEDKGEHKDEGETKLEPRKLRPPSLSPPPASLKTSILRPPSLSPSAFEAADNLDAQYSQILKDTESMKKELANKARVPPELSTPGVPSFSKTIERSKKLTRSFSNGLKAFSMRKSKTASTTHDDDWSVATTEFPSQGFVKSPGVSKTVVIDQEFESEEMEAQILDQINTLQADIKKKKEKKISTKLNKGVRSLLKRKGSKT